MDLDDALTVAVELEAFGLAESKKLNRKLGVRTIGERQDTNLGKRTLASFDGQRLAGRSDVPDVRISGKAWSTGGKGLYVRGNLAGVPLDFLVDTGADITIVRPEIYQKLSGSNRPELEEVFVEMRVADGRPLVFQGKGMFQLEINGLKVEHEVWVASIDTDGLLGYEFLQKFRCTIDAGLGRLTIGSRHETETKEEFGCFRVAVAETCVVAAGSEKIVTGRPVEEHRYKGAGVIEADEKFTKRHEADNYYQGTMVGSCYAVNVLGGEDNIGLDCHDAKRDGDVENSPSGADFGELAEHVQDLAKRSCNGLDVMQRRRVTKLLKDFADVFAKSPDDLGRTTLAKHRIDTGGAKPVRQAARRLPPTRKEEATTEVKRMLRQDIIEPSSSSWSSPVVLVKKGDGSTRFCVDYRRLNEVTTKDSFPLPRIDDSLDTLAGSKWFSTLDLASGYWQVEVHEDDRYKTAFVTHGGLYQFKVLPFGLCNAPATFERLMERVLRGLQWQTCLLYLDDIIVYGNSFDKAVNRLSEVLTRLREAGLKLSAKKCHLFRTQVTYLGHIVSQDGISPDPRKIESVTEWPTPSSVKHVRSFVGLCSYYRRFIRGFAEICSPLHKLTEKDKKFAWTEECERAFRTLKRSLTTAPVLGYPDETGLFILDTDACDVGIGGFFRNAWKEARKKPLKFLIRTDHGALRFDFEPEGQVARWLEVLLTYDFDIRHRPGKQHGNADALSRRPCGDCKHCERAEAKEAEQDDDYRIVGCNLEKLVVENSASTRQRSDLETAPPEVQSVKKAEQAPEDTPEEGANLDSGGRGQKPAWFHRWSDVELREMQIADKDIGPILLWKEVQDSRPDWAQITAGSPTLKNYWNQWDRLDLKEGVLYRRFESSDGMSVLLQLVAPRRIQEEILI
ncbi:Retrovirus-related Pol polyprotein from transposon [Apostichopus japonicus]|uniref:Retrovirus-related Pol polyprotein from transposon n=1 Tax=Stichopus japonicus TaxID=307972 RepID=A0A2G8JRY6_STIJA|nr:Retrovirus-related Pol polyprotein from transposon [Apostichopus japonicus]